MPGCYISFDVNVKITADFLMTKWIYSKHILNGVGWGSGVLHVEDPLFVDTLFLDKIRRKMPPAPRRRLCSLLTPRTMFWRRHCFSSNTLISNFLRFFLQWNFLHAKGLIMCQTVLAMISLIIPFSAISADSSCFDFEFHSTNIMKLGLCHKRDNYRRRSGWGGGDISPNIWTGERTMQSSPNVDT